MLFQFNGMILLYVFLDYNKVKDIAYILKHHYIIIILIKIKINVKFYNIMINIDLDFNILIMIMFNYTNN
jgi:hypothetical protein